MTFTVEQLSTITLVFEQRAEEATSQQSKKYLTEIADTARQSVVDKITRREING